jgi:hypothetical protein
MNWSEMEQELKGLPRTMPEFQVSKEQRVNLFVPAYVSTISDSWSNC